MKQYKKMTLRPPQLAASFIPDHRCSASAGNHLIDASTVTVPDLARSSPDENKVPRGRFKERLPAFDMNSPYLWLAPRDPVHPRLNWPI